MHSHEGDRPAEVPAGECRLQSPCSPSAAALVSLMGTLGEMNHATVSVVAPEPTGTVVPPSRSPIFHAYLPEAPPPRS